VRRARTRPSARAVRTRGVVRGNTLARVGQFGQSGYRRPGVARVEPGSRRRGTPARPGALPLDLEGDRLRRLRVRRRADVGDLHLRGLLDLRQLDLGLAVLQRGLDRLLADLD